MPDLRIALLIRSTRPSGSAVHTLALAEALARAGQQVSIWTLASDDDTGFCRPADPAVHLHAVPFPQVDGEDVAARGQRSSSVLAAALSAGSARFDVVHAQDDVAANAVPGRIRTVRHLDHMTPPELVDFHERSLLEPCGLVCISTAVAAELAKLWGRDAVLIRSGVEANRFGAAAGDSPEAVAQRQYWTDRFGDYVLAVGGIEPRKGTLDLVRAMARVRRRRSGTRLVIAGGDAAFHDRDYRREVDALAVRLRIDPEVLGWVPQAHLPSLVAAAGAFAFPSAEDGFGLAAMEALAAGVPVVTRDLPELREVLGDAVRFAEPGDGSSADFAAGLAAQLTAALEERTLEERILEGQILGALPARKPGQARAALYTWDDAAAAHLALYRRLISEGRQVGLPD